MYNKMALLLGTFQIKVLYILVYMYYACTVYNNLHKYIENQE